MSICTIIKLRLRNLARSSLIVKVIILMAIFLPSFHFGIILDKEEWNSVLERLKSKNHSIASEVKFLEGKVGEHQSFFVKDPNQLHCGI